MNASRSIKGFAQLLICLAVLIGSTQTGPSQIAPIAKYSFKTIDYSEGSETRLSGINDKGQIVGQCVVNKSKRVGLLLSDGVPFTKRAGTVETGFNGINRLGEIVGYSWDGEGYAIQGILISDGGQKAVNPGVGTSVANGINDKGTIVGESNAAGFPAFVYTQGAYTPIIPSDVTPLTALGINNKGQIVGEAGNSGYLLANDSLTLINFPGAARTAAIGINNGGDIVGVYYLSGASNGHGFWYNNGMFSTIDFPDAVETVPTDINNHGQIVGRYTDDANKIHGFLAEPQKGRR